jgi:transcriptional regulator with XRE-family HTH domain
MTNDFAERLKAARKSTGMTQQGMADRMLIPFRTIQQWEGGQRTPPPYVQRFVLNELESLKNEREEKV